MVPHAPLLLEAISGPRVSRRVSSCSDAIRALSPGASAVVIASPHGDGRGVYAGRRGDLDGFGHPGVSIETHSQDDLAGELTRTWRAPTLGFHFDHGVVTPLCVGLLPGLPVVAVALRDVEDAVMFAAALARVADHRPTRIFFVASAHLGAALNERAPVPLKPEAVQLEDEVLARLPSDAAVLAERARALAAVGHSCSAGPLTAFGHLFAGRAVEIAAYDRSFGVGYLVAHAA